MEISYGLVNLMYFMLCSEHWRIKGSRSNKRRKLLTCFTNSLLKVYNNLSLRETGPKVYNMGAHPGFFLERNPKEGLTLVKCLQNGLWKRLVRAGQ